MKRNRNVLFTEEPFKSKKVQQIIKDYPIVKGLHYSTDIDFLYSNMTTFLVLESQVHRGTHVSLFNNIIEDIEELKKYLINKYKHDYNRNLMTIINLSFSEN
jgi:hypothetical protein